MRKASLWTFRSFRRSIFMGAAAAAVLLAHLAAAAAPAPAFPSAAAFSLAAATLQPAPPPRLSVADFFRNPAVTGYQISPDGTLLASLRPWQRRLNIFIQNVGEGEPYRLTAVTDRDIRKYLWKNDHTIVYFKDTAGDENYHLFAVDTVTHATRDLTPFPGVKAILIDRLENNDEEMLIGLNLRNPAAFDAYRLNVATGALVMVAENPGYFTSFLADHNGNIRLATGKDPVTGANRIYYRPPTGGPFEEVYESPLGQSVEPLLYTFDNERVYALSNVGRDRRALIIFDPLNVDNLEVLYENPEVDVSGISASEKRGVLTAVTYTTDRRERFYFDPATRKLIANMANAAGPYLIDIVSHDREENKFVFLATSDKNRGQYYIYDQTANSVIRLDDPYPWLNENDMADMRSFQFKSRDGLTLHGYLILPKGREEKNLPLVVKPHGGPWSRDVWRYDPEAQFLANRGYAVLEVNFRGSDGYGRQFLDAGNKEWGRKMQNDITDAVQAMIQRGIADPKRIAIYGASYGGYAALAGLAFTPGLYACGIDYAGPSNLFTLLASVPPYWRPELAELYARIGNPETDADRLREASPLFSADRITAPLLIAQGGHDPRVKPSESEQIVAALRSRNVPVEYIFKENEGHGFADEENRLEFYQAMDDFLARYLGPGR